MRQSITAACTARHLRHTDSIRCEFLRSSSQRVSAALRSIRKQCSATFKTLLQHWSQMPSPSCNFCIWQLQHCFEIDASSPAHQRFCLKRTVMSAPEDGSDSVHHLHVLHRWLNMHTPWTISLAGRLIPPAPRGILPTPQSWHRAPRHGSQPRRRQGYRRPWAPVAGGVLWLLPAGPRGAQDLGRWSPASSSPVIKTQMGW